jgi:uncharacterized membrane protein/ElaB/YqjD/DUF883 family membrane-anchored ribosome-binding protein
MFHMASTTKSRRRPQIPADFDTIVDDLAGLKRDSALLMEQMKTGAIDGASETAQNLISQLNQRASDLYESVSDRAESSVKAISRHVEEQPITSLLVAFGVGMIAGHLLSR